MGFRGRNRDDELTATGLAKIRQAHARPALEWTSTYDGGAEKVRQGMDLPFGHATLRVQVKPDSGGVEFESEATVRDGDQEHLDDRHLTYVRYDPAHPDRCEIDRERLEQEFGQVGYGHAEKRNTIPLSASTEWARQSAGGDESSVGSTSEETPSVTAESSNVVAQLAQLAQMHAAGTLTDEEFAQAKARLLRGA